MAPKKNNPKKNNPAEEEQPRYEQITDLLYELNRASILPEHACTLPGLTVD